MFRPLENLSMILKYINPASVVWFIWRIKKLKLGVLARCPLLWMSPWKSGKNELCNILGSYTFNI